MRQYLRVAVVETSEESLRLIAGDEVLRQAARLVDGGMVADVRLDGLLVFATVAGTPVSVRVLEDALAWRCLCPDDAPCVHAAAAALAWVRTGTDEETPGLLAVLQGQSTTWLALRLAAIVDGNAELTRLLLAEAVDPEVPGALAELRAELESALDAHEEEAAGETEDGYGEWYPDFEGVEALIEEAGTYLEDAPGELRELAGYVITRIEGLLDYENCYGSGPTDALEMAHELHLAACRAAPPDPVALADRLVSARLSTGWDVVADGPAKYADVLGPAGLARCAELLGQQEGKKGHALTELRESMARAQAALATAGPEASGWKEASIA
jgi:SWIM zinc finger